MRLGIILLALLAYMGPGNAQEHQSAPCRWIRKPKVGEQNCEEWAAVRIPSGCVVAYDCIGKIPSGGRLIPALERPDCPDIKRPEANPECFGYDVFRDDNGCIYEFRCIPKDEVYQDPVTKSVKTKPQTRQKPKKEPSRPELQSTAESQKPESQKNQPEVAIKLSEALSAPCPKIERPTVDPKCIEYNVKKDENGCVVQYVCIEKRPKVKGTPEDEKTEVPSSVSATKAPLVVCQPIEEPDPIPGCEFFHGVRDANGCVVRFDCVPSRDNSGKPAKISGKDVEQGILRRRAPSGCPEIKRPALQPGCLGYRQIRDSDGCIEKFQCIPVGTKWQCPKVKRPGFNPRCIGYRIRKDRNDCIRKYECIPVGARWNAKERRREVEQIERSSETCEPIEEPEPVVGCSFFHAVRDPRGCVVRFDCIPGELDFDYRIDGPSAVVGRGLAAARPKPSITTTPKPTTTQQPDTDTYDEYEDREPREGIDYICPKVDRPAFNSSCLGYTPIRDTNKCIIDYFCIPRNRGPRTGLAAMPKPPITTTPKPPKPTTTEEPDTDTYDEYEDREPREGIDYICPKVDRPAFNSSCLGYIPLRDTNKCLIDYFCIPRNRGPAAASGDRFQLKLVEPCTPVNRPVNRPECADFEAVENKDGCITEYKCIPKSQPSKCIPQEKPAVNDVCSDWLPVEDARGCVTSHKCVFGPTTPKPVAGCKHALIPENGSKFCRSFRSVRDDNGCIRMWFCVPTYFPETIPQPKEPPPPSKQPSPPPVPERQSESKCSELLKPEPNRDCQEWVAITDRQTGCVRTYGCVPRPKPVCPPTPLPTPDDRCIEWEPVEDERYCIKEYRCILKEELPTCHQVDPPVPPECSEWEAIRNEQGCIERFECLKSSAPEREDKPKCLRMPPPKPGDDPNCIDWRPVRKDGCVVNYECITSPVVHVEPQQPQSGPKCAKIDPPSMWRKECKDWRVVLNEHGCIVKYECVPHRATVAEEKQIDNSILCPLFPPPSKQENPHCDSFKAIKDATGCIVDYECTINSPVPSFPSLISVEQQKKDCVPAPKPQTTRECVDFRPILDMDGCIFNYECVPSASLDARAKLIEPAEWQPSQHGNTWVQPQAQPLEHAVQPAPVQIHAAQPADWQEPQVWEQGEAAQEQPRDVAHRTRPGPFQPGPRADGQPAACASVHVPPTNYRCSGWTPQYDEETGCIDHYECVPAPPVAHIPPTRPCPHVPRPAINELCRWTARIEPRTGCKAYYECRPRQTPGSFCPVVPFPRPVKRCQWTPVFNRDTGCVISYRCAVVPDCPNKLGGPPAARDGCIWTVVTDSKGCDKEYKCVDHGGNNDAGIPYVKASGEVLIKQVPACDPRDPHVCTGWREPMEWGCCARYRDFPKSHFRWHNRGCYCEPNRRRCVIERTVPGTGNRDFKDQWTYCVPKETFDCYNNFFLKGALCEY